MRRPAMTRAVALLVVTVLSACGGYFGGAADEREPALQVTGVISYIDLEGGFWGIQADDGENYFPLNLDASFQVDGLRVRFSFRLTPALTTAQWGRTITIEKIERE